MFSKKSQKGLRFRRSFLRFFVEQCSFHVAVFTFDITVKPCRPPPDKSGSKFFEKMRFCKTCRTLTTIQLREKTHLSEVVSLLKRFGQPMKVLCENRIFWLKFKLSNHIWYPTVGGTQMRVQSKIFNQKNRFY